MTVSGSEMDAEGSASNSLEDTLYQTQQSKTDQSEQNLLFNAQYLWYWDHSQEIAFMAGFGPLARFSNRTSHQQILSNNSDGSFNSTDAKTSTKSWGAGVSGIAGWITT